MLFWSGGRCEADVDKAWLFEGRRGRVGRRIHSRARRMRRGERARGSAKNLEFWGFDEGRVAFAKAAYKSKEFKSKHGDVTINFRILPYEQMHDELLTALVSGEGAPDIADIEISRFSLFIKGDHVPLLG